MVNHDVGDLKAYAEYVADAELAEGSVYFRVSYLDEMSLVPMLQPFVFIGRNLNDDDENEVYFQDAASYAAGVRVDDTGKEDDVRNAFVFSGSATDGHVMEFGEALRTLVKCELRRREAAPLIKGS